MNMLFTHSVPFKKYNGALYAVTFNKQLWEDRYLPIFDHITVIGRDGGEVDASVAAKLSIANTENVNFILLPYKNIEYAKLFHNIKLHKIFKDAIRECDCLIARVPSTVSSLAINEAKRQGKPYLIEVVGCPWDALWNHSLRGKLLAPFSYLSMKRVVKNAPYAIYVTNEFLQRRYPCSGNKWISCSNVELSSFDDSILEERTSKINNHYGKIIIGTTAAVDVRYKGQQNVIKALGRLKRQGNNNFEYHLVGSGNKDYLKAVAEKYNVSENIKFLGTLPHEKIFRWLDNIDIYIQPSKQEGLPRALIEAMSRGLPCIGSNAGGIPELLDVDYIYRTQKNEAEQIENLLINLTKHKMIDQSRRNYEKSKEYERSVLLGRRDTFLRGFVNEITS